MKIKNLTQTEKPACFLVLQKKVTHPNFGILKSLSLSKIHKKVPSQQFQFIKVPELV